MQIAFNPTLVLFQPTLAEGISAVGEALFQSHFGLISTEQHERGVQFSRYFQSHFGLISTITSTSQELTIVGFQSHFGLISTHEMWNDLTTTISFQSHFGLISTESLQKTSMQHESLSIPLWSYFNQLRESNIIPIRAAFNPTLVLFQRPLADAVVVLKDAFNPTLVLFQPDGRG